MSVDVYFDPDKSNLAEAFALDGLAPVLRHTEGSTFLLTDNSKSFYIYDAEDGRMFVFKDDYDQEKAVDSVLTGVNRIDLGQQFNRNAGK